VHHDDEHDDDDDEEEDDDDYVYFNFIAFPSSFHVYIIHTF